MDKTAKVAKTTKTTAVKLLAAVLALAAATAPAFARAAVIALAAGAGDGFRRLTLDEYRDKMQGAWYGQSIGVVYGFPVEFKYIKGELIPEDKMPEWKPGLLNGTFHQDDLYVEMTFLATLDKHGLGVSPRRAGIDFANTTYLTWWANRAGRDNIRKGVAPPDSSHPSLHRSTDAIDYQIEADYSGIISPGLPGSAIRLGGLFGRMVNYGDGLYAGIFVGAMYSEAFFETDRVRVVEKALEAIPVGSRYAEMVRDVLAWHRESPDDYAPTYAKIVAKWLKDPEWNGTQAFPPIDASLNGAIVLMGFLYGEGDMEKTMRIATRGGMDADCNPSTACGVLGVMLGAKGIDGKYFEGLDRSRKWDSTEYTHDDLFAVCERLARRIVAAEGGRVERGADGREEFVIPVRKTVAPPLEDSRNPGPATGARYTEEEMAQIRYLPCATEGAPSLCGRDKRDPPGGFIETALPTNDKWQMINDK